MKVVSIVAMSAEHKLPSLLFQSYSPYITPRPGLRMEVVVNIIRGVSHKQFPDILSSTSIVRRRIEVLRTFDLAAK